MTYLNTKIENANFQMIEFIGMISHSFKIKRGHIRQKVAAEWFISNKTENEEIKTDYKIKAKGIHKRNKHAVDIIRINHSASTVEMFNVKSDGISNTENKFDTVKLYLAAIKGAEEEWPNYQVSYSILRKNGKIIEEYETHGIKTFDLDKYVGFNVDLKAEKEFRLHKILYESMLKTFDKLDVDFDDQLIIQKFLFPE